jgi:hypothetical protein
VIVDWTIHVSDLWIAGAAAAGGCVYVARVLRKRIEQLDLHQEELVEHRKALIQDVGWTPDPERGLSRTKGAA